MWMKRARSLCLVESKSAGRGTCIGCRGNLPSPPPYDTGRRGVETPAAFRKVQAGARTSGLGAVTYEERTDSRWHRMRHIWVLIAVVLLFHPLHLSLRWKRGRREGDSSMPECSAGSGAWPGPDVPWPRSKVTCWLAFGRLEFQPPVLREPTTVAPACLSSSSFHTSPRTQEHCATRNDILPP
jgi:hypothetical protein